MSRPPRTNGGQKALLHLDGTPPSRGVAEYFAGRAELEGLSVVLYGVSNRIREGEAAERRLTGRRAETAYEELNDRLENIKKFLLERDLPKQSVEDIHEQTTERVPVSEKIITYAREHDIDLIVMGKHNKPKSEEFLFGDTAIQVVRKTNIPTLIVKGTERPAAPA